MKEEANVESVISKGSTVDEAVRLGLEKLQTTRDQVSIEVIQTEKKTNARLAFTRSGRENHKN